MFDPARFMATFARHGLLESAVVHSVGGDVTVDVGLSNQDLNGFDVAAIPVKQMEFQTSALTGLKRGIRVDVGGLAYIVASAPRLLGDGAFSSVQLELMP